MWGGWLLACFLRNAKPTSKNLRRLFPHKKIKGTLKYYIYSDITFLSGFHLSTKQLNSVYSYL